MRFLCFGPRLRLDAARHSGSAGSVGSHRPPRVEVLDSWPCTTQMPKPLACEVRERPSCHAQPAGPEPWSTLLPGLLGQSYCARVRPRPWWGRETRVVEALSRPPTSSPVLGHWARCAADRTQEQGPGPPPRPSHGPGCGFRGATEPGWPERNEGWGGKGQSPRLGGLDGYTRGLPRACPSRPGWTLPCMGPWASPRPTVCRRMASGEQSCRAGRERM